MVQIRSQMRTKSAHSPKSKTLMPTVRSSVPMVFQFFCLSADVICIEHAVHDFRR